MAHVESTRTIATKGVGRPDYSGEIWQAKVVKRLELHENEVFKSFLLTATAVASPYVWVVAPIVAGAAAYLIDGDTGLPMPYVIPVGYELEVMMIWASFNQNQRIFTEFEGFEISEFFHDALDVYYENEVMEFNTKYIDPDALAAHLVGFGGQNVGLAAMSGCAEVIAILRRIHTEIPTSKVIRCKWCDNTTSTSLTTVQWKCTKCGKLNLYYHHPSTLLRGGTK